MPNNTTRKFMSSVGVEIGVTKEHRSVNLWFDTSISLIALRRSEVKKLIEMLREMIQEKP